MDEGKIKRDQFDSGIISAVVAIKADESRKEKKIINLKSTWKKLGYLQ